MNSTSAPRSRNCAASVRQRMMWPVPIVIEASARIATFTRSSCRFGPKVGQQRLLQTLVALDVGIDCRQSRLPPEEIEHIGRREHGLARIERAIDAGDELKVGGLVT